MTSYAEPRGRIAYIVSRYPKLSETFIVREMDALEERGWDIAVFPFINHVEDTLHPSAERWLARLNPRGELTDVLKALLAWTLEAPGRMLFLCLLIIRHLWSRPGELARGFIALGRAAYWARCMRTQGVQHVHAHFGRHPVVAALAVSHLIDIPYSYTGHSEDIHRYQVMIGEKVRRAQFVAIISRFLRDTYVRPHTRPDDMRKVHIVRCGVDTARYAARPPRTSGAALPTMLTVARLDEVKGLPYLIDACRLLRGGGRAVRCRIIGEGPLREVLQQQIETQGLADTVTLLGARTQREVEEELAAADVFVLPSIITGNRNFEGVPVSLMEAMGMGVPVVATRTGAIPELVQDGETGLLVEQRDPRALATAVERVLDDATLAGRLIAGARAHLRTEFDLATNITRLDGLLAESVGTRQEARHTSAQPVAHSIAVEPVQARGISS